MKKISLLLLLLATVLCFSCSKDDDKETPADYLVLGITSVTINGQPLSVTSGVMLDVNNVKNMTINSVENQITKKHISINYAILDNSVVTPTVSFTSIYPDVSIVVAEKTGDKTHSFTVTVTRKGYEEQLTYTFVFTKM
ncbi:hypothetical protein [uncultured Acetobacteroides sp.]|uniref:hypothetical protein n=1 Tax=uncultured Acetobacteroides sp. TaxID=1760811 RepID=UPI0029F5C462|nr:hypothetical protein [uncultured Acetobacteroides sp.]